LAVLRKAITSIWLIELRIFSLDPQAFSRQY